jgi:predicted nucleotidyltransferase
MLKLISFYDRSAGSNRDAKDIFFIVENYLYAGNEDRLFEENQDIFDDDRFSLSLAGARLLGRDIAKIASPETKDLIIEIISNETDPNGQNRLITQSREYTMDSDNFSERRLNQLNYLSRGLMEG